MVKKSPVKATVNIQYKTPELIHCIPNTPDSLNRKRSFSRVFKNDEIKSKMSKGGLAKVVEEPTAPVVGYLQIFSSKKLSS